MSTTPKPTKSPGDALGALYEFLQALIPEGHDRCHVDKSCAGGPEPCAAEERAR